MNNIVLVFALVAMTSTLSAHDRKPPVRSERAMPSQDVPVCKPTAVAVVCDIVPGVCSITYGKRTDCALHHNRR